MMRLAVRSQFMPHAAAQCEAGSFARFFLDHAFMDTTALVSIFVILLCAVAGARIILLAVLLAALVILGVVRYRTQPFPQTEGR